MSDAHHHHGYIILTEVERGHNEFFEIFLTTCENVVVLTMNSLCSLYVPLFITYKSEYSPSIYCTCMSESLTPYYPVPFHSLNLTPPITL